MDRHYRKYKKLTLKGKVRLGIEKVSDFVKYNIIWPVKRPVDKFLDFIRYRTWDKYHIVKTELEPHYWDKDHILLYSNFAILADFVEDECAFMELCWHKEKRKRLVHKLYFLVPRPFDQFFRFRDRQAGLDFINWHADRVMDAEERKNLGLESEEEYKNHVESYSAPWKEIRSLYLWWRDTYPNRRDPMDLSGWSEWCNRKRERDGDIFPSVPCAWDKDGIPTMYEIVDNNTDWEAKEQRRILDECHRIEREQDDEDTEMLTRLIKVRHTLWT